MSQVRITLPITVELFQGLQGEDERSRDIRRKENLAADFYFVPGVHDKQFGFCSEPGVARFGPFNPWQLRDEFLSWPLGALFPWVLSEKGAFVNMGVSGGIISFRKTSMEEWQRLLKEALVRPAREWRQLEATFDPRKVKKLFTPLPVQLDWDGEVPIAVVKMGMTLESIIATIQLDKLQGAEFRACARSDCKSAPFKVEARHKLYCSSDCAHLVAVRNSRARAAHRKINSKRKGRESTARK